MAVLLVVLYHADLAGVTGGFIGVDVFFTLSGYLITGILLSEAERTSTIRFVQFYARRARRLLPAAALVLGAVIAAEVLLYAPDERAHLGKSALYTALYASNAFFLVESADYFAPGTEENPLLHTWSLSVEEQFYVVWPLIVLLASRRGRSRQQLAATVVAITVLSFAASLVLTTARPSWAFFGTPFRAWEFGVGGLASLVPAHLVQRLRPFGGALGAVGILGVVGTALLLTAETPFPGTAALVPTLGTALLLVIGSDGRQPLVVRALHASPLQWLGRLSYSWYLWHWPVLVIAAALLPSIPIIVKLACVLGSLALAALTFAVVENPIRFHRGLQPRPRTTMALAGALTVVCAVVAFGARRSGEALAATPEFSIYSSAERDRPAADVQGCTVGFAQREPHECVFGDSASQTTVVLFGDSHASHWLPAVEHVATSRGWRVITLMKSSCPTAEVTVFNKRLKRLFVECDEWRAAALARIEEIRPNVVILGNYSMQEATGVDDAGAYVATTPREWADGLRSTVGRLDRAGTTAILLRDVPRLGTRVPSCLARATLRGSDRSSCDAPRAIALDSTIVAAEREALRPFAAARIVDLSDSFCDPQQCHAMRDGMVVYRDAHHLTAAFARTLAPALSRELGEMPTGSN